MKRILTLAALLLVILVLVGCNQNQPPAPQPAATQVPCPECPTCPEAQACPEPQACPEAPACPAPVVENVPFEEQWANSPHNDITSEAFNHWNEEDPQEIPTDCAKCHSTPGYLDFLGADGSTPNVVDVAAPISTTITCEACHNDVTVIKDTVTFPSGIEVAHLGDESRCMECHQGRESTISVNNAISETGVTDVDQVSEDLGFRNIHYYAAAATQYGSLAKGGYEYEGKVYDTKFFHVEGFSTCNTCHNPHTLELNLEQCATCHTDVKSVEDIATIRMAGSEADYDGDGDVEEGVQAEVAGVQEVLFAAIQSYAADKAGAPIVYSSAAYPYFFIDTNADGQAGDDEAVFPNAYKSWTPRLLKAAYNFQAASKDPGQFAHNGKYIIQTMFDSIEDLSTVVSTTVPLEQMARNDAGHFNGASEVFRHWDEEGMVPGGCVKCHTKEGVPEFIANNANVEKMPSNGFTCTTCHENLEDYKTYEVKSVTFPSGASVTFSEDPEVADPANLCLLCHQGRESTVSINRAIAGKDLDTVDPAVRFRNVHYFAAGATLFGTEVKGAYEYPEQAYLGRFEHVGAADTCTECHNTHELELKFEKCTDCHEGVESPRDIRGPSSDADYDGDGDTTEGLYGEVVTSAEKLLAALQLYANDVAGAPIAYDGARYPYFFSDANGNGIVDADEADAYPNWTPRLLQAAYNFQYATKDPGDYTHNGKYILQTLYDSLSSLGEQVAVDMAGMVRPEVPAE
jgi:hypothetical protein